MVRPKCRAVVGEALWRIRSCGRTTTPRSWPWSCICMTDVSPRTVSPMPTTIHHNRARTHAHTHTHTHHIPMPRFTVFLHLAFVDSHRFSLFAQKILSFLLFHASCCGRVLFNQCSFACSSLFSFLYFFSFFVSYTRKVRWVKYGNWQFNWNFCPFRFPMARFTVTTSNVSCAHPPILCCGAQGKENSSSSSSSSSSFFFFFFFLSVWTVLPGHSGSSSTFFSFGHNALKCQRTAKFAVCICYLV